MIPMVSPTLSIRSLKAAGKMEPDRLQGEVEKHLESLPGFCVYLLGFPQLRGTFFGGPYKKDYSILGSILGYPYFGKLPYLCDTVCIV